MTFQKMYVTNISTFQTDTLTSERCVTKFVTLLTLSFEAPKSEITVVASNSASSRSLFPGLTRSNSTHFYLDEFKFASDLPFPKWAPLSWRGFYVRTCQSAIRGLFGPICQAYLVWFAWRRPCTPRMRKLRNESRTRYRRRPGKSASDRLPPLLSPGTRERERSKWKSENIPPIRADKVGGKTAALKI